MKRENRELLESRYRDRSVVIRRIRERWDKTPPATAVELDHWRADDRR